LSIRTFNSSRKSDLSELLPVPITLAFFILKGVELSDGGFGKGGGGGGGGAIEAVVAGVVTGAVCTEAAA